LDGLIRFRDDRPFATGATQYFIGQPGDVGSGRLLVKVSVEGQHTTAAVDTGGLYFVCDPELADALSSRLTDPLPMAGIGETELTIRGTTYAGELHLLTVELLAIEGRALPVEATVFIPRLRPHQVWHLPSIMGFQGLLDRIRFAVDPNDSFFYFGPLGDI
jgi:hypothetical protein